MELHFRLGGFATGHYMNRCSVCGNEFFGDKRAVTCLKCTLIQIEDMASENSRLRAALDEVPEMCYERIVSKIYDGGAWYMICIKKSDLLRKHGLDHSVDDGKLVTNSGGKNEI